MLGILKQLSKHLHFHQIIENSSRWKQNRQKKENPWSNGCKRGIWILRPEFDSHDSHDDTTLNVTDDGFRQYVYIVP